METFEKKTYRIKLIQVIALITICFFTYNAYGQSKYYNDTIGVNNAKQELKLALSDMSIHNVVKQTKILLNTKDKAINFAELILFDIYGKKEIESQRPYRIFNIDNYWVINGTLTKAVGGTFLMLFDSHDCEILRITHGQ